MSPIGAMRGLGNSLGLAWWAKIETRSPNATYWFGPFLTRRSLENGLDNFLDDLSMEGSYSINKEFLRCRKGEPLTI